MQGFLGAEEGAGADDVDHAAGVATHLLHQHGEVAYLHLHVVDEGTVDVQQSAGLCVPLLQGVEPLPRRQVEAVLIFILLAGRQWR